ncbi:MAG: hypothetical protein HC890_12655 [Chloroflexaceae bacterium]|nr:hypothetical protein [Chloroflexaceae bacterium]
MLYLAEVKRQNRGLMGGARTELKLLACQRSDQTWSQVPGEEVVACETISQVGEGALVMVSLTAARQVQGTPELAGARLVRLLQNFSRLIEKAREQEEEIEQWKQSLAYQSQELSRRELELEARLEQLEQGEGAAQGESSSSPLQGLPQLQELLTRLSAAIAQTQALRGPYHGLEQALRRQQEILDAHWQHLQQQQMLSQQQQGEAEAEQASLMGDREDWQQQLGSLEEARRQWQQQQDLLHGKRESHGWLRLQLVALEELQELTSRLASVTGVVVEHQMNFDALENMPLGELEGIVANLQQDLEKLVCFVNDQEEELSFQCQVVDELQEKLANSNDYDRLDLESKLADEQECKGMLDETLLGQRRTLRERQEILLQHLKILRRRQGIVDLELDRQDIDLNPLLERLTRLYQQTQEKCRSLEVEIEQLQQGLPTIEELLAQQQRQHQEREAQLRDRETRCHQLQMKAREMEARVEIYQATLQPLQERLNELRQQLDSLGQVVAKFDHNGQQELTQQVEETVNRLFSSAEKPTS